LLARDCHCRTNTRGMLVVKRVQFLGSSRSGLGEWLVQRMSALYIAGFLLYLIIRFSADPVADYDAWLQWFGNGMVRAAFGVFGLSLVAHSWVGMRSVYLDYLHPFWLRLTVTGLTGASLLALLVWMGRLLVETRIP